MPQRTSSGRYSGAAYDPETNLTTGAAGGPHGAGRTVEEGNHLDRYAEPMPHGVSSRISGSVYDPSTNRTTTVIGRPGAYGRMIEMGNTLARH